MNRYNNYHKHDHVSSIITPDSNTKPIEYIQRAIELGEPNVFTTNHGTGGDIFEYKMLADQNNVHCKFGLEGYIVPNPLEKDTRNYHIMLIPKTNVARKKLNLANSRANEEGFYYKPRLFIEDLLYNFDDDELYITTACMAGFIRDKDGYDYIFKPLYEKYGKNLMLEVQNHNNDAQRAVNERAINLAKKHNLNLIAANDSHYVYPEEIHERANILAGKGITYQDEDVFILDYPDYDTFAQRFKTQGMLNNKQITDAIDITLIFDECEDIEIDNSVKMPTIYPESSEAEKIDKLKKILNKEYKEMIKVDHIPKEERALYKEEIKKEMKVIEETSEVHSADYFLFNKEMLDKAINEYGGILTRSGRGSCGSFLINKVLGITQIDRLKTNLPLYSERFMSTARLLENKAMPDIDYNIVAQEPFVKATKDLLGEHGCYPMIAYGTMQESEAFRNLCRAKEIPYDEMDKVAKNLEKYEDDPQWKDIIAEAKKYVGTIVSKSPHPCAYVLYNGDIREEIGVIKVKNVLCAMITSAEADYWKYLKNDYLLVTVWDLIAKVFAAIGQPIMNVSKLFSNLDDKTWKLFEDGITATLNQVDGAWATSLVKKYKPKSPEELAMFVACIRPSFESFRDDFINRREFTTGSTALDNVFTQTNHYVLFQENLMQFFQWLGVSPAESIGLIKKISKKKIKQEDFDALAGRLHDEWINKTGSEDGFDDIWADMQAAMGYGFNCIAGDEKLWRSKNGSEELTIEEMYRIKNDLEYAKANNKMSLRKKYRQFGYGKALSLCEDGRLRENNILSIELAGVRDVCRITTESGKTIKCTKNHNFPTPNGKVQLQDLSVGDELYCYYKYDKNYISHKLTNGNNNYPSKGEQGFQSIPNCASHNFNNTREKHVKNHDCCEKCGVTYNKKLNFELHHKDGNSANNNPENYEWLCNSCHKIEHYKLGRTKRYKKGILPKLEKIVSIEKVGMQSVYDVSMEAPYHNYLTSTGIVTSNSPHGLAYAIDCLYCAYLKAHYPLEYYTTVLNTYEKDEDKTKKLVQELDYFDIKLSSIKFRYSQADYSFDRDTNTIYKGITSIKYLNKKIARQLYDMGNMDIPDFYALKKALKKTNVDTRQLDILIKLNFFSEFGDVNKLLKMNEIYDEFDGRKQFNISDNLEYEDLIAKHASNTTAKLYKDVDGEALIKDIWAATTYKDTSIIDLIEYENELLGYINMTIPTADSKYALVLNVNKKYKNKLVTLYRLNNGDVEEVKVKGKVYDTAPINKGDIIKTMQASEEKKWKRDSEGNFYQIDETETILKKWAVLNYKG